jgi:hypothetical protein
MTDEKLIEEVEMLSHEYWYINETCIAMDGTELLDALPRLLELAKDGLRWRENAHIAIEIDVDGKMGYVWRMPASDDDVQAQETKHD